MNEINIYKMNKSNIYKMNKINLYIYIKSRKVQIALSC